MKKRLILISAALLFGLAACGQSAGEETPGAAPLTPAPTAVATAAVTPGITAPVGPETGLPEPSGVETAVATPGATVEPVASPPPVAVSSPVPTAEPTLEPVPAERLSDEEVLAAYEQATEAYGWFTGYFEWTDTFLDKEDMEKRPYSTQDLEYCRVIRSGLDSLDTLRGYLKSLFSDEIVDSLLTESAEVPSFIETEKGLYILCAGVGDGGSEKGAVTSVTVLWPEGELPVGCVVRVTQERLDWGDAGTLGETPTVVGEWVYEFPYQKVGDKWVFTEFGSIF